MASWKNATTTEPTTRGVLRPAETEATAHLRRDADVHPMLAPFVERYWSVRWDRTGRPPFRSEVLSHPSVNLSVESGDGTRFGLALPAVLVHGVVTRRFTVDLVGVGRVTAVKFRPGGFRAFTGVLPARNAVAPLGSELGIDSDRLRVTVLAAEDDADRAAVLDAVLAPRAPNPEPAYLDLLAVLDRMIGDRSLVRVEQVAALAGLSIRSLQRLFAGYVGVSPKAVMARYRLQDAAALIDTAEVDDLAGLAASLGWFDQAHFSRDFRSVVGMPPAAYLRRARQDNQPVTPPDAQPRHPAQGGVRHLGHSSIAATAPSTATSPPTPWPPWAPS
ncbi:MULTISPECIES: helix-turn-helix domain-containing protein [unclassified Modestobacter]|uniref:helix-turn-helix domain-containing protein n=1 Tax=unclassified Modestobacter TaxID=2643866 RepID=UPI0022AAEDD2|nr:MULTISPECIES: helix-turn-helix domain-containing protein [unclassified Modestobacter]MCZ2825866.1 helix-turn-helix domain-containing protein [Modestobacter sp. VKM Ac-2981]MCZ2853069.1 helix-turn-helix domain-containing protein [Modestobacter sp. VKM Ac-2982]